jgi:hypothetical protein
MSAKSADLLRYPDLSLSVIMRLGAGKYVVELSGGSSAGHFGLAVEGYARSTAPYRNRLNFRDEENDSVTQLPDHAM